MTELLISTFREVPQFALTANVVFAAFGTSKKGLV